jgi:hypothetical protein
MWTPTTRKQHIRETNRYQTDVTDKEWRVIEPHLPAAKSTGRPRACLSWLYRHSEVLSKDMRADGRLAVSVRTDAEKAAWGKGQSSGFDSSSPKPPMREQATTAK